MVINDVLILGAGPCGMSTAIALAKLPCEPDSPPLRITLVEVRPKLSTIGGTVNLTPLAMRYLDYLGVGSHLREKSIPLDDGLDYLSLRTGQRLGNIWGGIGARRAARHDLVSSLLETIQESHCDSIEIQWGRRLVDISETEDKVVVKFEGSDEPLRFDIMIGADGIHSQARHLFVEPNREKTFSGRVCVMGWNEEAHQKGESGGIPGMGKAEPPLKLASGESALRDTVIINGFNGILLGSYYEPSRSKVYLVHIALMDEPKDGNGRDGWNIVGNDKIAIRDNVCDAYRGGKIEGLEQLVENCQDWHLWPVYILPGQGRWYRGRVLLLGDASHAMVPQGESTGFAIEDGIAFAHVMSRRKSRTVEQLFSDLVALRKPFIDKEYNWALWQMEHGFIKTSGFRSRLLEWGTALILLWKRWTQDSQFARDVRNLELPA